MFCTGALRQFCVHELREAPGGVTLFEWAARCADNSLSAAHGVQGARMFSWIPRGELGLRLAFARLSNVRVCGMYNVLDHCFMLSERCYRLWAYGYFARPKRKSICEAPVSIHGRIEHCKRRLFWNRNLVVFTRTIFFYILPQGWCRYASGRVRLAWRNARFRYWPLWWQRLRSHLRKCKAVTT